MENTTEKIKERIGCKLCGGSALPWGTKILMNCSSALDANLFSCGRCPIHILSTRKTIFPVQNTDFGYVDYDTDKEPMIPAFNRYLDMCLEWSKMVFDHVPKKLFDVGAATGFFLHIAQARGFEVSGVEMSAFAVGLAKKKGIDVLVGDMLTRYSWRKF